MPLPRQVTLFNRAVVNPIARRFAGRVPPLAIVEHRGRRSGRQYRTPVVGWFSGEEFVIPLTYGPDTDWVKNLRAADGGRLITGSRTYQFKAPRVSGGIAQAPGVPRLIRQLLPIIRVDNYLRLRPVLNVEESPHA